MRKRACSLRHLREAPEPYRRPCFYREEAKRIRDRKRKRARKLKKLLVAMRLGVTPVPIPNTMVKTQAADGTMLETAWESRWLPESLKKQLARVLYIDTDTSEWMENKTKSVWRMC